MENRRRLFRLPELLKNIFSSLINLKMMIVWGRLLRLATMKASKQFTIYFSYGRTKKSTLYGCKEKPQQVSLPWLEWCTRFSVAKKSSSKKTSLPLVNSQRRVWGHKLPRVKISNCHMHLVLILPIYSTCSKEQVLWLETTSISLTVTSSKRLSSSSLPTPFLLWLIRIFTHKTTGINGSPWWLV